MRRSTRETEIKLPFETPESALEELHRLGARELEARQFEDNVLYDRPHDPLRETGRLLRLRRVGDRAIVTFKAPVAGKTRHKVREEHETTVGDADALACVFEGLGFTRSYRYQKYRTVFSLGRLHVCLDETPVGCFVELEGEADDIDRAAERLGFTPDRYIVTSYRDLHVQACRTRNEPPGDMLLGTGGKNG